MSPNPGQEGHEVRGWTHAICDADYFARAPIKGWQPAPHRVTEDGEPVSVACCYCGLPTRGIYVREDAQLVHGRVHA